MANAERITRSSLWLVPPKHSQLHEALSALINQTIPVLFPDALLPNFAPHITLSADTVPNGLADPQEWLDQLELPDLNKLKITIGDLEVGSIFFQKLIQLCEKTGPMCDLSARCRQSGTQQGGGPVREWVEKNWRPHCSLVYSDLSREEVLARLDNIKAKIRETRESMGSDCLTARGASIWLVPTFKDVGEWSPIATRELDADIEWEWKT